MIDCDLIEKIKKKDKKGLDILIDEYGKLCYGVIASVLLPNGMEANIDDCFNDVLTTVWFKIGMFENNKGKLRNWLISICKFRALDYLRKKGENLDIYDQHISDNSNLEASLLKKEESEKLLKAIESLGDIDKEIFNLRYIEDRDIDYISKKLGIEKGNIYTRISRGKEKIKKVMEVYYE